MDTKGKLQKNKEKPVGSQVSQRSGAHVFQELRGTSNNSLRVPFSLSSEGDTWQKQHVTDKCSLSPLYNWVGLL